ncbi:MAG: hypothetical protein ACFCU8_07870 [Thermosynechococcaceae cyanobacterium]
MQVFQIKDLAARGVLTPNASTLMVKGCPFHRGPAFAKSRWQIAQKYSHLLDQSGAKNFVVEEDLCISVWRAAPSLVTPSITVTPAAPPAPTAPISSMPTGLEQRFVDQCEQELTLYVGPIAKRLVETTIAQLNHQDSAALVSALAQKIPDPMLAQMFCDKLLQILSRQLKVLA